MSEAKNIIKRLVNSTDKLRVNVTELLKLIKTKQDKLPTDGSSEEFLAKDGQYHTVKSSTQSNWEQNDENADDYIKNRPFYKKSELYTFPNADYTTPYFSSEEANVILYKIADEFVKPKTFEGSILTGHVKGGEPESVEIIVEGDDANSTEFRDDETGELLQVMLIDVFTILYVDVPILGEDSEIIPQGIYYVVDFSDDSSIGILDSIELILDLKQIDKKFIPSDYATVDDVEGVSNQIQIAQTTANAAQTTANAAQTTANAAQTTANAATNKADQALNTINNAFYVMAIENAYRLFYTGNFKKPPVAYVESKCFGFTFNDCKNMTECGLSSLFYKPTTITGIFQGCKSLKTIKVDQIIEGIGFDLGNCTNTSAAFMGCTSLSYIQGIKNIEVSISFSQCPLDDETVGKILDALVKGTDPQTLTLRSDIVEKLTDDQFAKIPSNWTIQ